MLGGIGARVRYRQHYLNSRQTRQRILEACGRGGRNIFHTDKKDKNNVAMTASPTRGLPLPTPYAPVLLDDHLHTPNVHTPATR